MGCLQFAWCYGEVYSRPLFLTLSECSAQNLICFLVRAWFLRNTYDSVVSKLKRFLFQSRTLRIMDTNSFALGILIALSACLANVSSQRERCLGNYCSGSFGDMKAICKDGYCYCTGQDYDYNTCLRKLLFLILVRQTVSFSVRSSGDPLMDFNFFNFSWCLWMSNRGQF